MPLCGTKPAAKRSTRQFEFAFLNLCQDVRTYDEKELNEQLEMIWKQAEEAK